MAENTNTTNTAIVTNEAIEGEIVRQEQNNVVQSVGNISQKLATMLEDVVEDLQTLEIRTYTNKDMDRNSSVRLRAATKIHLDGDVEVTVPEKKKGEDGTTEIDEKIWALHKEMVEMAQDKRIAFIQSIAETATTLMNAHRK